MVQVLKRLRKQGQGSKSHPRDLENPGIEPAVVKHKNRMKNLSFEISFYNFQRG